MALASGARRRINIRTAAAFPGHGPNCGDFKRPLAPGRTAWAGALGVEIMAPARDRDGGNALKGGQDGQSLL